MKKSTANHMHRKRRKNNLTWLFALLGILVLFLGTILAFLIFSNLSSKPTETVQEVSAVNVEKDIPETDIVNGKFSSLQCNESKRVRECLLWLQR